MSMTEVRHLQAKCLDMGNDDAVVLHQVDFEIKESGGNWLQHSVEIMATDPMDAIDYVRKEYK